MIAVALATAAPPASAQQSIIGGHDAAADTWPSLVALIRHVAPDTYNGQFCGGTLVTTSWVLTAAHCVDGETAATVDVLGGTHTLGDGSGTRVTVAEIHEHPGWNSVTKVDDLALLKLATPLALPTTGVPSPALAGLWAAGRTAHVAGWGDTDPDDNVDTYPVALKEVDVPLLADSACAGVYGGYTGAVMVCAGDLANGGIDTCQGDSGGPLVVDDAAGGKVLAGDTSYGAGCAQPGSPGVYGEIAGMRAFVDATIGWSTAAGANATALTFARGGVGIPTAPQAVTLTSTGSAPLSIAAARVTGGPGASDFAIVADGCSQVVLELGESCSVSVRATPTADADRAATLALDGDGAAGTTSVALTTAPGLVGDPPPGGGGGTTTTPTVTTPTPPPAITTPAPPVRAKPRAPVAKLRVLAPSKGVHRIAVTLDAPGKITITLTRKVRRGGRSVTQRLGTASGTFAAAGTRTLKVKLTRDGRRALRGKAHPKATATVTTRSDGATAKSTRAVTLR